MERHEWLDIQKKAQETTPQSMYHDCDLQTVILLAEILDRLWRLEQKANQELRK